MAFNGKVILCVEGEPSPRIRLGEPLDLIWREHLVKTLDLVEIDRIRPISKKNILRMDPTARMSGSGAIAIDEMIAADIEKAKAAKTDVDAFVIAWDLQPPWDPKVAACRSDEVLSFYYGLANSNALPDDPWRIIAARRHHELSIRRQNPGAPAPRPRLVRGAIHAMCMEHTFESLLMVCETRIREILGVASLNVLDWPAWDQSARRPEDILQLAIKATRKLAKQRSRVARVIPGDMTTAKNDWGEYFLRKMIEDPDCLERLRDHPISRRMKAILAK